MRGEMKSPKHDGIHRAAMRGASTHYGNHAEEVARELAHGGVEAEPGKTGLLATREAVVDGWSAVADLLHQQGYRDLSIAVRQFSNRMPPPHTDKERIAEQLLGAARVKQVERPTPVR